MRLLLLGAGGFIGSHLVERLLREENITILAYDRDLTRLDEIRQLRPEFPDRVEVSQGDLSEDIEFVRELVRGSDVVVDLIAYANPSVYVERPVDVVQLNFFDNLQVVNACVDYGKHLIQFSSCEVYGISAGRTEAFSEDQSALIMGPVSEHRWIYASAKQLLERMVHAYGLGNRLTYTIVRPFNFIGPRIDYLPVPGTFGGPRVFSHFMAALLSGGPMHLVDGGTAQRSYTYATDAAEAFWLILQSVGGECRNQIMNIGTPGNETSIRDLALEMKTVWKELTGLDSSCELKDVPGKEFYGAGYADCDRRIPDVTKLRALGWAPRHTLRETIRESMRYYVEKNRQKG